MVAGRWRKAAGMEWWAARLESGGTKCGWNVGEPNAAGMENLRLGGHGFWEKTGNSWGRHGLQGQMEGWLRLYDYGMGVTA